MYECHDNHDFSRGSHAYDDLAPEDRLHWHPDKMSEVERWHIPGSDRVRDSEFDIVTSVEHVDRHTYKVGWRGQNHWHEGYVPKGNLSYEASDDPKGMNRWYLLPPPGPSQDEVDEALASILNTYEKD